MNAEESFAKDSIMGLMTALNMDLINHDEKVSHLPSFNHLVFQVD